MELTIIVNIPLPSAYTLLLVVAGDEVCHLDTGQLPHQQSSCYVGSREGVKPWQGFSLAVPSACTAGPGGISRFLSPTPVTKYRFLQS